MTIKEIVYRIANFSATEDERDKEWWGKDTNLGVNLVDDIEKELVKLQLATLKEVLKLIEFNENNDDVYLDNLQKQIEAKIKELEKDGYE